MKERLVCNRCGKDLDIWDAQQGFSIHTTVQYGSVHDGETITLRLCCECFDQLLDACKVSPVVGEEAAG